MRALFFVALKSKTSIYKHINTTKESKENQIIKENLLNLKIPSTRKSEREVITILPILEGYINTNSTRPHIVKIPKKDTARSPFNPRVESPLVRAGMSTLKSYDNFRGERSSLSPVRNTRNFALINKKSKPPLPSPRKITLNICKKTQMVSKL